MKPYYKSLLLIIICSLFIFDTAISQELASIFTPKNNTEKLVLEKIRAVPEVKQWLNFKLKEGKPDIIINEPDGALKNYRLQIGTSFPDIFRTSFWLYIDPKTFKIYYWDITSESDEQTITLQQWRYWRTKPEWHKPHICKNGELIIVK